MELLIAAAISCKSAEDIISRIKPSTPNKSEIVQVIKLNSEEGCFKDAQVD